MRRRAKPEAGRIEVVRVEWSHRQVGAVGLVVRVVERWGGEGKGGDKGGRRSLVRGLVEQGRAVLSSQEGAGGGVVVS